MMIFLGQYKTTAADGFGLAHGVSLHLEMLNVTRRFIIELTRQADDFVGTKNHPMDINKYIFR